MLLTIDIGNTNVVAVVYDENRTRLYTQRFATVKHDADVFYRTLIQKDFLPLLSEIEISSYCLSCVVPSITASVIEALESTLKIKGINLSTQTVPDFIIHLDKPSDLGADFIATSFGAMAKYRLPIVLADLGSATKISVLNSRGEFEGGIISPGVGISIDALNRFIPQLPEIKMEIPARVIGRDTITSMQSGWLHGTIAMVEGLADKIENELGQKATRVLTGGYSIPLHEGFPEFNFDEYLLNEGLFEIDRKYNPNHLGVSKKDTSK